VFRSHCSCMMSWQNKFACTVPSIMQCRQSSDADSPSHRLAFRSILDNILPLRSSLFTFASFQTAEYLCLHHYNSLDKRERRSTHAQRQVSLLFQNSSVFGLVCLHGAADRWCDGWANMSNSIRHYSCNILPFQYLVQVQPTLLALMTASAVHNDWASFLHQWHLILGNHASRVSACLCSKMMCFFTSSRISMAGSAESSTGYNISSCRLILVNPPP
jgi:hypothetical protein